MLLFPRTNRCTLHRFLLGKSFACHELFGFFESSCRKKGQKRLFHIRRAAVLTKMTRFEFEYKRFQLAAEDRKQIDERKSNMKRLQELHENYYKCIDKITRKLRDSGVDVHVVDRFNYNEEVIKWADIIITAGGDGTFLLAASKVRAIKKPVVGVNTDPERSEGYLCMPKHQYTADNLEEAIQRINCDKFSWKWRHRIRITLSGYHGNEQPIELHDQQLNYPEFRFSEHVKERESNLQPRGKELPNFPPRILPVLALNEVFIGESLSSRVSYFEIGVDGGKEIKQKNSGITICTGTGSSSWFFHINHLAEAAVKDILKITKKYTNNDIDVDDNQLIQRVTADFNNSLRFDPSLVKMAYTLRDPIVNKVFRERTQRGFAQQIQINSRMWDGHIVVDGGMSFAFNDGAVATMEIHEEDALRTVQFD